jgi:hypothetical protein
MTIVGTVERDLMEVVRITDVVRLMEALEWLIVGNASFLFLIETNQ